jgi:hypothetical protein
MNTKLTNSLLHGVLIITLVSENSDLTNQFENNAKRHLHPQDEPKFFDGLQLHLPEIPSEEGLIWHAVAANSGVQSISQSQS